MADEEMTALDSLKQVARAQRQVRGGRRELVDLWAAIEILANHTVDHDKPFVVLGLTGRAGKPQDGNAGGGGAREPLRWPRPPTDPREDFLKL